VVTVAIEGLKVRFNHVFDVADAAGRIHVRIDAKARTGDLDALWKLVRTDMARLEMDEASFCIGFQDGSIIRSINLLDVRQPISNRCQGTRNIIRRTSWIDPGMREGCVKNENWARARA
jgi:hypothetical protein